MFFSYTFNFFNFIYEFIIWLQELIKLKINTKHLIFNI